MFFDKILKTLVFMVLMSYFLIANAAEDKYRVAVSDLVIGKSVSSTNAKIIQNSELLKEIENAIRNSRKFELLSRDSNVLAKIRTEQNFANGELTEKDGAVEEGKIKTAQSLIIVEVTNFSLGHNAKKMPRVEKYEVSDSANIKLTVQLVDTTSGSINISFPVEASASTPVRVSNSTSGNPSSLVPGIIKKLSEQITTKMFDAIYPISVVAVSGKDIYVNRGQDSGISVGQLFDIFEKGESIIDPDTGEELGTTESELGVAKVVSIKPKTTILEMKNGDISRVKKGNLARKHQK